MGLGAFETPYDWGRLREYSNIADGCPGGSVDLSVGSPVDPVPRRVMIALADAADYPGYPATIGSPELRTAIADWTMNFRDVDLRQMGASTVPTVGSKEAVALMASILGLGRGDVVVQPRVSYPTYEIGTQIAGATVLKVDDVADVESWSHDDRVRMVWVNSPSNPTGRMLSVAQMAAIVKAARSIGAVVVSDECYALMSWSGLPARSVLDPAVCGIDCSGVIMLYSLSKQSNMAGYRAAFLAGDASLVDRIVSYRRQMGLIVPGPVQGAMVGALRGVRDVNEQASRYHSRLTRIVGALSTAGYDASMPEGGLYVWVRALGCDCWEDMRNLARVGVLASPGEFYGDSRYLRFSATARDADIDTACERISRDLVAL
ncbi:succinyldiaminopimelate transaminase [uncultured Bifidobacterium sp.]|uniref:succinyldiaminopimelate transaminase n=1 Tax=uncultured Bifidobacterium sp. TaxID=165187 RepID=UPI00262E3E05|nr:succinyldiaminopimelate transaminase [uncultured Bifidobacterium sp.]